LRVTVSGTLHHGVEQVSLFDGSEILPAAGGALKRRGTSENGFFDRGVCLCEICAGLEAKDDL